jgi:hypothetical protein
MFISDKDESNMATETTIIRTTGNPMDPEFLAGG